jgi:AbrB family looped-hinge helix DNA binding protein
MSSENEELVKITSGGTVSIPKRFRKYLEMQKGDYVKVVLEDGRLFIKKANIT